MNLKNKRRIAASALKVGRNRVWFDESRLDEIKEVITKSNIRKLINDRTIQARPERSTSRFRIRKRIMQKRKGRRKGPGSRKGSRTARLPKKITWISNVRVQRDFLKMLKSKKMITQKNFWGVYKKIKGGFFRSRRHLKLYLNEHNLIKVEK